MRRLSGRRLKLLAGMAYLLGLVCFALALPVSAQAPVSCLIYAVNDPGGADSEHFTIDPVTNAVNALGPRYTNTDYEGLDIHPVTNLVYISAGDGGNVAGDLNIVDAQTGALTFVGNTGNWQVAALSFRSTDASLWGWATGSGLISINSATGAASVVFASAVNIEGLAWTTDGSLLYGSQGTNLFVYNPVGPTFTQIANNLPGTTDVEALEMLVNGHLMGGAHETTGVTIFAYDPVTLQVVASESILTPYTDVEGLAWPEYCGVPPIGGPPPTPTNTPPPGPSPTNTPTTGPSPTNTLTATPTNTPTATPICVTGTPPPTATGVPSPTPIPTCVPTSTATNTPPPSATPTNTSPAPTNTPGPPPPTQPTTVPPVAPPVPIPPTGGEGAPPLIPQTGADLTTQRPAANGLFLTLGLTMLALGLDLHGLSLRLPREE